jgi:hypothetical protein
MTIINEILDFSKIESGVLELEQKAFDLIPNLEDVLDIFGARSAEKNIDLAYLYDAHTPLAIYSDPSRLRQVLVNLVGNALKFIETGEVVVEISSRRIPRDEVPLGNEYLRELDAAHAQDPEWLMLKFKVQDSGPGIPADRMDRLFRAFSQVDSSITRRYGGTGLGLVIAKRLVEAMGGKIWVESTMNVGTSFFFTLYTLPAPSHRRLNQPPHPRHPDHALGHGPARVRPRGGSAPVARKRRALRCRAAGPPDARPRWIDPGPKNPRAGGSPNHSADPAEFLPAFARAGWRRPGRICHPPDQADQAG